MLTSLELGNFKSWRTTDTVILAPLTALFGVNSSGKTSLLQMLLMLKQTADSPDRAQVLDLGDDRSLVELGTFHDIIYAGDLTSALTWSLTWTLPRPLRIADPSDAARSLLQSDSLGFSGSVHWSGGGDLSRGRPIVGSMEYAFAGSRFGMRPKKGSTTEYDLYSSEFTFSRGRGRAWGLPAPAKCYGFPDQVRAYYQNASFLSDFELEFERLLSGVFYLGPLRGYPQRQYIWAGAQPLDMGRRGERVVDALLAARDSGTKISRGKGRKRLTLEQQVATWLRDLGLTEGFDVRAVGEGSKLYQVWVKRSPLAPEVLITDVGFGMSQVLPVIALCYYVPEGSTIILEQPEIHLHPSAQAGLADVFIDAIRTRKIQIILESHSEHLLRRLQRRIAEGALTSDDTALYFCTMGDDGSSRLNKLQLDLFGNIRNWPKDFFGDAIGDLVAMTEAMASRLSGPREPNQ